MACRSLSSPVKSLCSATCGSLSSSIALRRSYVVTTENMRAAGLSKGGFEQSKDGTKSVGSDAESAWGPDPVTGYYRPSNRAAEIDPVELRDMLLRNKVKSA